MTPLQSDALVFFGATGDLAYKKIKDSATFTAIRKELGSSQRPAHYLAIPPLLFALVVGQLAKSGCTDGARVIIEKPFGRDLVSAQDLNRILLGTFDENGIRAALIHDHFSARQGVEDDHMNILCMGGRTVGPAVAWDLIQTLLAAEFGQAERYLRRLEKIAQMER
jgi:glucose-6-phosphate 1-dehydrogenase